MKIAEKMKFLLRSLMLKAGAVSTDKAELLFDGDELEIGKEVFVADGDEVVAAPDGEYSTDEKVITVESGKVTDIKDKESDNESGTTEEVSVSAARQKFSKVKEAFEATYEEKYQKIYEAIKALGQEYFYIAEASDSEAVVEIWNDDTDSYKTLRYEITWNEDGTAVASNPVEVKQEYVPVEDSEKFEEQGAAEPADSNETGDTAEVKSTEDRLSDLEVALGEIREGLDTLTNAIAAAVKRIEAVEEKIKGLEEPAADPAEEGEETEVQASRLSYLNRNNK